MGRIKKTILITGANGYIGKNLCEQLPQNYNLLTPSRKEFDLLNQRQVNNFFDSHSVDTVIHCALVGGSRREENTSGALLENMRAFFNLTGNKKKFRKMIHLGSGAEYNKSRPIKSVKEVQFGKSIPQDDYGLFKYMCSRYIEKENSIVCLRIFGLFGKYEDYRYRFISNAIVNNLNGLPITINKNVYFDYLYIDDFVNVVDHFINHNAKYTCYNIGSGNRIDLVSIAKMVNEIADNKSAILVKNVGLDNEYTCNVKRCINELGEFQVTKMKDAIKLLYSWYKMHHFAGIHSSNGK